MQSPQTHDHNDLRTAISVRLEARETLQKCAAALERAKRVADDARSQVTSHQQTVERAATQHTQAVERFIIEGNSGSPPIFVADERAAKALRIAESQLAIAQRALSTLQQQHATAQENLAAAESSVRDAVRGILVSESLAMAAQIVQHERAAIALRERIIALDTVMLRDTPVRPGVTPLKGKPSDHFPLPRYVSELLHENGPHRIRIAEAEQQWKAKIAALIDGAAIDPVSTEPPRAA
jgi:hypothetical protein